VRDIAVANVGRIRGDDLGHQRELLVGHKQDAFLQRRARREQVLESALHRRAVHREQDALAWGQVLVHIFLEAEGQLVVGVFGLAVGFGFA